MSSYASLYANTKINTDDTQYLNYKNYLYARVVMEQYRTNYSDGIEIQMPSYIYNQDVNKYPVGKISYPEFLKYERKIQEFINSCNEFLKTF